MQIDRYDLDQLRLVLEKLIARLDEYSGKNKDAWDKFDLVTKFLATVLIVVAGGVFTYYYTRSKDNEESARQFQQQQVHTLEVVSRFAPQLADEREHIRQAGIYFIAKLLGPKAAVEIALITRTPELPNTLVTLAERNKDESQLIQAAIQEVIASDEFQGIEVFFASNRNIADSERFRYGPLRADQTFGFSTVTIPSSHKMGDLEQPSLFRLEFSEDPKKHVVIASQELLADQLFLGRLQERLEGSSDEVLVYVHGFNTSFEDAVRRLAQLTYDLNFNGVPVLYSWPSQGSIAGYVVDETNVDWAIPHFAKTLADIIDTAGPRKVSVIAHGLGTRAVTWGLADLQTGRPAGSAPLVNEVVLIAPDIDAEVFSKMAAMWTPIASRVTRYVSSSDAALIASARVHGRPRAGESGVEDAGVPGLETVDVTDSDTSLVGHAYYGDTGTVIADLFQVLRGFSPDQRSGLRLVGPDLWSLAPM